MLIDDVTILVKAGKGGNGAIAFNKNKMALGPVGGSGGDGGSVWLTGVSDIGALAQFRKSKYFRAGEGKNGHGQFRDGENGKDLALSVPVGTVIYNLARGTDTEITLIGEKTRVAAGGNGGWGNFHFRGPKNTSPMKANAGLPGEECTLRLELKLIADVGLIGLPNVGKSSLLNALTKARAKVANYLFTTLEPNLGAYYDLILADIPGLIEGASEGKGLGHKFLRHVERTRVLFHLVSAESEDPATDYKTVRDELSRYNPELARKPEYLFLSKVDLMGLERASEKVKILAKLNPTASAISALEKDSLKPVRDILTKLLAEKVDPSADGS